MLYEVITVDYLKVAVDYLKVAVDYLKVAVDYLKVALYDGVKQCSKLCYFLITVMTRSKNFEHGTNMSYNFV